MHDIDLAKKLFDRSLFTRIRPYIKEWSVSSITWHVVQGLDAYYKSYPHTDTVVFDDFKKWFFILYSKDIKGEKHTLYTTYFDKLDKCDPDSELLDDVLKNYITKDYATQIFNAAMSITTDRDESTMDDIGNLVTAYNREVGRAVTKSDLFVPVSLSFLAKSCGSKGLTWRLNELNMSLGPIRQGDLVIVAARPETGKTTLMASEVSNFIAQLEDDRPIMWVNNEESGDKVMFRVLQAYFGLTVGDIEADMPKYEKEFQEVVKERFLLCSDDSGLNSVKKLNALFEEYNPSLIVFDQLDKVQGFDKAEREDLRIGNLYEWARELAKKYGPVLAVSQIDGSGEGQKWLHMNQLRGSKTDKIGEADAIVTIGKSPDPADGNKRYISVVKNKLFGGPISEEMYRHGCFEVDIVPHLARYVGVH